MNDGARQAMQVMGNHEHLAFLHQIRSATTARHLHLLPSLHSRELAGALPAVSALQLWPTSQQRPAHGPAKANAHTFKCHSLSSSGTTEVTPSSSNLIFKLNVGIVGMGRQQEARRRKRQEGGARSAVLTWQRKLSNVLNLSTCYAGLRPERSVFSLPRYFDSEPCRSRCIMLSTLALSLTFT